jgi:DUF3096 family protein
MTFTLNAAMLQPIVALLAGILILLIPRILNFATRTTITAVQAQFSLAQLLQFAQLTTDNWDTLTHA